MATTTQNNDCSACSTQLNGAPQVGLQGVTRRDHPRSFETREAVSVLMFGDNTYCRVKYGPNTKPNVHIVNKDRSVDVVFANVQSDSPHSSLLQKILRGVQFGSEMFGLGSVTKPFTAPLSALSSAIGKATGWTGIFDQPSVFVDTENANAVVDIPQSVRSLRYHEDDYISRSVAPVTHYSSSFDILDRCRIPTRVANVQWASTMISGTQLVNVHLFPGLAPYVDIPGSRTYDSTPMSFFSTFFGKWRGSLHVTIEVVCTAVHQGQLFIAFNPDGELVPSRDAARTCPFKIIDISESDRHGELVPFLSEFDYNLTTLEYQDSSRPTTQPLGRFFVWVQNPLIAPATVSATVDINVYVSAGEDFEFIEPSNDAEFLYPDLGVYQSGTEGVVESVVDPPVGNQLGVTGKTHGPAVSSNVATAETDNILGREYLVSSGQTWSTTAAVGTSILSINLPSAFWNTDFATNGLARFHQFQHCDFEVTIKVNQSSFHAGQLICYWVPGFTGDTTPFASLTQFQHKFINLRKETVATIICPYSSYRRMMRTKPNQDFGTLNVVVWNQLRTAATNPSTLYVSATIKALNPYVGVKCVAHAVVQSGDGRAPSPMQVRFSDSFDDIGSLDFHDRPIDVYVSHASHHYVGFGVRATLSDDILQIHDSLHLLDFCTMTIDEDDAGTAPSPGCVSLFYVAQCHFKYFSVLSGFEKSVRGSVLFACQEGPHAFVVRLRRDAVVQSGMDTGDEYASYTSLCSNFQSLVFSDDMEVDVEDEVPSIRNSDVLIVSDESFNGVPYHYIAAPWTRTDVSLHVHGTPVDLQCLPHMSIECDLTPPCHVSHPIERCWFCRDHEIIPVSRVYFKSPYHHSESGYVAADVRFAYFYGDLLVVATRNIGPIAVVQSGTDAAQETDTTTLVYDSQSRPRSGYVRSSHMRFKDLMRRPDYVATINVDASVLRSNWTRVARIPALCGKNHLALMQSFTYWSGTNKIFVVTDSPVNQQYVFAVQYGAHTTSAFPVVDTTVAPVGYLNLFDGVAVIRVLDKNSFVIDIPMYKQTPLVSTNRDSNAWPNSTSNDPGLWSPYVDLLVQGVNGAGKCAITLSHSVSDDFEVFLPRAFPPVRLISFPSTNGLVPVMTSANDQGWSITGGSIAAGTQAWWAFNPDAGSVAFSSQTGRYIQATHGDAVRCDGLGLRIASALPAPMSCAINRDAVTDTITIPAGVTSYYFALPARSAKILEINFNTTVVGGISVVQLQWFDGARAIVQCGGDADVQVGFVPFPVFSSTASMAHSVLSTAYSATQTLGDRLVEFGANVRHVFSGLINVSKGVAIASDEALWRILRGIQDLFDKILSFASGILLIFGTDNNIARAVGAAQLSRLFVGMLVPQRQEPAAVQSGEKTIYGYIRDFYVHCRNWIVDLSGFSVAHLKRYLDIKTKGLHNFDYLFAFLDAVVHYIVVGDKALYDHGVELIGSFVDKVHAGVTKENHVELLLLKKDIDDLACRIGKYRFPTTYNQYVKKLEDAVEKIQTKFDARGSIPEPIGMYFFARPGTGKSTVICKVLPSLLMRAFKYVGDPEDFYVNTSIDHQGRIDKYDGQPVAIFDEFGSNRESNEVAMIIRFISQFAETVNSAFMEKKGKSFRSRLLVVLSNLDNVASFSDKINNAEAIPRRFRNFSFAIEPRAGVFNMERYMDDLDKVVAGSTRSNMIVRVTEFIDSVVVFRRLNLMSGATDVDTIPFSTIFRDLVAEWKRKEEIFERGEDIYKLIAGTTPQTAKSQNGGDSDDEDVVYDAPVSAEVLGDDDEEYRFVPPPKWSVPDVNDLLGASAPSTSSPAVLNLDSPHGGVRRRYPFLEHHDIDRMWGNSKTVLYDDPPINPASSVVSAFDDEEFLDRPALRPIRRINRVGEPVWESFVARYRRARPGEMRIVCMEVGTDILLRSNENTDIFVSDLRDLVQAMVEDGVKDAHYDGGAPTDYGQLFHLAADTLRRLDAPPYPGLSSWLVCAGVAATVVAAIVGLCYGLQKLVGFYRGCAQTGYTDQAWKIQPKQATSAEVRNVMAQSGDERHEKIRRNIRKVVIRGTKLFQSVLCIDNRTLCLNAHFYRYWLDSKSTFEISVHGSNGDIIDFVPLTLPTDLPNVIVQGGKPTDMVIVNLVHSTIPGARSIRGFLRSQNDTTSARVKADLLHMNSACDMSGSLRLGSALTLALNTGATSVCGEAYEFCTKSGDCGRPYVVASDKPLIGIHCAASENRAYFVPLFLEYFQPSIAVETEPVPLSCKPASSWFTLPLPIYGKAQFGNVPLVANASPVSSLVPMKRHGLIFKHSEWECDMLPTDLSMKGPSSALSVSSAKYVRQADVAIPFWIHSKVSRYWSSLLPATAAPPLTMTDAINGVCADVQLNSLQWSTSLGWLGKSIGGKGKSALFDCDEDGVHTFSALAHTKKIPPYDLTFVDLLSSQLDKLENGIVPFSPWVGCLKDEVRPRVKVEAKKSRIFEIPSVEMSLLIRKEFGQFLGFVKKHFGFVFCHGIGADKEREWARYYDEFRRLGDGKRFIDIDYANYDGSITSSAFDFFRELTDQYYAHHGVVRQRARHALLYYLQYSYVILGDHLIQTRGGNKSGNPMTDVLNSLTNVYLIHSVLLALRRASQMDTAPGFFHKDFRVLTYGDDVLMGLSDDALKWFDPNVFAATLRSLGYGVTDAAKSSTISFKELNECQFLKSRFVPHFGVVLCPMPKESIYKELLWEKRSCVNDDVVFQQKIEQTQQFMFHHGEVEYRKFQAELRERGVSGELLTVSWDVRLESLAESQRAATSERAKSVWHHQASSNG